MSKTDAENMLKGGFKNGLLECGKEPCNCFLSCCLAPYAIAKTAEAVGEKSGLTWLVGYFMCPIVAGGLLRARVRRAQGLPGNLCTDFLIHCCCTPCAICQETSEMKSLEELTSLAADETPVTVQPK